MVFGATLKQMNVVTYNLHNFALTLMSMKFTDRSAYTHIKNLLLYYKVLKLDTGDD